MDFIESLGKQLSEITAYDVKSYYDKAKNMVMNYTEMESKVREATNGDPWGASSTLMQEIAQGTFNFQLFNEILPVIYKRFSEKEAHEWRQIYKALQLLEYLVKHGSERVVDDARSHVSMIKMLRNFHYIDEKGKDQGLNVRNRSKELAELLGDLERIRSERRKAKQNRAKYTGVSNEDSRFGGGGSSSGGGGRYGGFGSESFNAGSSSSYGRDRDDFSREPQVASHNFGGVSTRRESFEEYDAGDDDATAAPSTSSATRSGSRARGGSVAPAPIKKDTPKLQQAKEVNLFDFDDEEPEQAAAPAAQPAAASGASFDDDFDDFQSAGPTPQPAAAPAPAASKPAAPSGGSATFFDMMGMADSLPPTNNGTRSGMTSSAPLSPVASPPAYGQQGGLPRTSQNMPAGPTYPGVGMFSSTNNSSNGGMRPNMPAQSNSFSSLPAASSSSAGGAKKASSAFDFDDLFAASGAKTSSSASGGAGGAKQGSLAALQAQKQSSQLWGASGTTGTSGGSGGNNDLLF